MVDNAQQWVVWSMISHLLAPGSLSAQNSPFTPTTHASGAHRTASRSKKTATWKYRAANFLSVRLIRRCSRVWINLFANAFKFTRQQETAQIQVGCQQTWQARIFCRQWCGLYAVPTNSSAYSSVCTVLRSMREPGVWLLCSAFHRHSGSVWAGELKVQRSTLPLGIHDR